MLCLPIWDTAEKGFSRVFLKDYRFSCAYKKYAITYIYNIYTHTLGYKIQLFTIRNNEIERRKIMNSHNKINATNKSFKKNTHIHIIYIINATKNHTQARPGYIWVELFPVKIKINWVSNQVLFFKSM